MHDDGERGIEHMKDIHRRLDEEEKHAEYGDDEVEVRDAKSAIMRQWSAAASPEARNARRAP